MIQSTLKPDWVFGRPTPTFRIIIPRTKAGESSISIIYSARITERLEPWVGVLGDFAPDIIVHPLGHFAGLGIHDQPHAPQVIADDSIVRTVLDHVTRNVDFVSVHEPAYYIVVSVQLRDRVQLASIEKALLQGSITEFSDSSVLAIDNVLNVSAVW